MQGFSGMMWLISIGLLCLAVFALVDAAIRRGDAYPAADKKTKGLWLALLGGTVVVNVLGIVFLQIAGLIATIVYIVDVRPALKQITGGPSGPRRGGSSSDGPYGPFNR